MAKQQALVYKNWAVAIPFLCYLFFISIDRSESNDIVIDFNAFSAVPSHLLLHPMRVHFICINIPMDRLKMQRDPTSRFTRTYTFISTYSPS